MRKKLKIYIFSKIAQRFLSNFVDLLYTRTPRMWHYRLFPENSLKLEKLFLIFCPLSNVAPKLTDQSRSHSISRKNMKISIFSKVAPTIFMKFCGFIAHSKPNNVTLSAFPEKIPETEKEN